MLKLLAIAKSKAAIYGGILIILLGGIWLFASRNGGDEELLTVKRDEFIQEVSVSGKVVSAQNVSLGFGQGGRVSRIYVKVGDRVSAGRILAEVENGDLRASVAQKEAALERERASLALLEGGTREEELAVSRSEIESAEVALTQARDSLVEAVKDAFTTSDDAIRNVLDQFIDTPRTNPQLDFIVSDSQLENRIENARLNLETTLIKWQTETEHLTVSNLQSAVSNAQAHLSNVSRLLTDANAALNKAIPTGSITQAIIDGYKTDIAGARTKVNSAISSLTSKVTAEKNAVSALATAQKSLLLKEAGTRGGDISGQEAQVKAAEADLGSARAQLAKTLIVAPFAGVITDVEAEVGESISAGGSAVSMIGTGKYQVESYVPEVNIALIELGDSARITLDAYGSDVEFAARVASIDPAETIRDGVSTYRIILQFETRDERIKSGMTANVRITTDRRDGVLSVPQGIVVQKAGKKYVAIRVGKETIEKEVTTGSVSSIGTIEILSGLEEGDILILPEGKTSKNSGGVR